LTNQRIAGDFCDAYIDPNFAIPPYRVENAKDDGSSELSFIANARGFNVLRFKSKPGAVFSSKADCEWFLATTQGAMN